MENEGKGRDAESMRLRLEGNQRGGMKASNGTV